MALLRSTLNCTAYHKLLKTAGVNYNYEVLHKGDKTSNYEEKIGNAMCFQITSECTRFYIELSINKVLFA